MKMSVMAASCGKAHLWRAGTQGAAAASRKLQVQTIAQAWVLHWSMLCRTAVISRSGCSCASLTSGRAQAQQPLRHSACSPERQLVSKGAEGHPHAAVAHS